MKDYASFMNEKPFSCNVDGCTMKFVNEDHLTVHKKRHDMVLNLGLGHKGTTFADQTPTPTRFIRNCEEVGLFQDLQNVNPFEETFRKATEAVKTGYIQLDRPFQANPPDDTLHTPNIFPHITDVNLSSLPCISQTEDSRNIQTHEDLKVSSPKPMIYTVIDNSQTALKSPTWTKAQKKLKLANGKKGHKRKSIHKIEQQIKMDGTLVPIVPKIFEVSLPAEEFIPMDLLSEEESVKERLRTAIRVRSADELNTKVPIPKASGIDKKSSIVQKFSTFSKNSLKLIPKLNNADFEIFDVKSQKRKKRTGNYLLHESRSEYLARNRAAATRCREKKKMYITYLEKLNRDLTVTNQNLQFLNVSLMEQVTKLNTELQRHKACNVSDDETQTVLNSVTTTVKSVGKQGGKSQRTKARSIEQKAVPNEKMNPVVEHKVDVDAVAFDIVEVTLGSSEVEETVPLMEETKGTDIIVHFDNSGEDFVGNISVDSHRCYMFGEQWKQQSDEHCYHSRKFKIDVSKRFLNYNVSSSASPVKSEDVDEATALGREVYSEVKTLTSDGVVLGTGVAPPPPLILLKPFKKRTLTKSLENS